MPNYKTGCTEAYPLIRPETHSNTFSCRKIRGISCSSHDKRFANAEETHKIAPPAKIPYPTTTSDESPCRRDLLHPAARKLREFPDG